MLIYESIIFKLNFYFFKNYHQFIIFIFKSFPLLAPTHFITNFN